MADPEECSLCTGPFTDSLLDYIAKFSLPTGRVFDDATKGKNRRVREPYHVLNQTMLRRIIPILLKVKPLIDSSNVFYFDLCSLFADRDRQGKITVDLAKVFQNYIIDSDWLKDHLADIEISITITPESDIPVGGFPHWLPSLNGLYSFMVITMLRYPTTLARHVLNKYAKFATGPSDHSNFIVEMRPVLEECAISIFLAEVLNLGREARIGQFSVLDSIVETRRTFCELLKTYITGVLIPRQEHLNSEHFDRSEFLQRINSLDILSEEAGSIGSILKLELNRLKALCKRMHVSAKPFLCYNFSSVVEYLLKAISNWFDKRIILYQQKILDDFLKITGEQDLSNPIKSTYQRQLSVDNPNEMEDYRDEKQKELLGKMMIGLRTNKGNFIDEEAQKAFQFCGEIRQNLEKAIGYRLIAPVQELQSYLANENYVKLDLESEEDKKNAAEFDYYCQENLISDFQNEKSAFLEESFDLMQNSVEGDMSTPVAIMPDQLVKVDSNNNVEPMGYDLPDDMSFDIEDDGAPIGFNIPFDLAETASMEIRRLPIPNLPVNGKVKPVDLDLAITGSSQIARPPPINRSFQDSQTQSTQISTQSTQISTQNSTQRRSQSQSGPPLERQDSTISEAIFIVRKRGATAAWSGKRYEIRPSRLGIVPQFAVQMPSSCDVLLLTSHIGNEKTLTAEFKPFVELVVKPIGLTKRAQETVDTLRERVLNVAKRVIYVIDQQVKIFDALRNAILDAHELNESRNLNGFGENLEYLEKEYPAAIRKIYRSFNKYFFEIKKLAKKPFQVPCNMRDKFFEEYQKLVLKVFYDWVDFELEKMRELTIRHNFNLQKTVKEGPAYFQRQFLESRFLETLDSAQTQKFQEYLQTVERVFQTEGQNNQDVRRNSGFRRNVDGDIDANTTFGQRARLAVKKLERDQQKKYAETLNYGKVHGEPHFFTNSDRFQKTYAGKQVLFTYDIRKRIGQGTFGRVSQAIRLDTGDSLAIKEIQFMHDDEEEILGVENELLANEELHHPNIVLFHGYKQVERKIQIVFEYCESNLLWEAKNGLEPRLITMYTAQLLDAVAFMHERFWVHRDIKPSNIFLKSTGTKCVVKLGDFGSAHQISPQPVQATMRGEPARGSKGCTTHYSSPEVHANNNGYGRSVDVWSIGCTVLEMITGKIPWTKNHHTLETQKVIYQMCHFNRSPLDHLGELPKFSKDPFYTRYATGFLKRCFEPFTTRPTAKLLKLDVFLDQIATLEDIHGVH